jgi:UDP:flavonoid glycosyltransferase YjiC (YdhE family)
VVANGGFTLLGEAVYLRRPVLSVPVHKQFEQVLNARYLEREGYGLAAEEATGEALGRFLERIPDLRRNLEGYRQDGNAELFRTLDRLLETVARGERGPEQPPGS